MLNYSLLFYIEIETQAFFYLTNTSQRDAGTFYFIVSTIILPRILLKLTSHVIEHPLFIFLIYRTFHPRFLDDLYFARFERHGAFALLSSDVAGGRVATSTNLFCPSSAA